MSLRILKSIPFNVPGRGNELADFTSEVVGRVIGSSRICSTEDSLRFFFDRDDAPRLTV